MPQLVQTGAHHLGLAAQAVRVLHAVVTVKVGKANGAAFQQSTVILRHVDLAGLTAQGMNARIEGSVATARGIDRQGANHKGRFQHRFERQQGMQGQRRRSLGAVDQGKSFLGAELQWLDSSLLQCGQRRNSLTVFKHGALAQQSQRHVRQRRQVTRRTDRALRWHERHQAGVMHR